MIPKYRPCLWTQYSYTFNRNIVSILHVHSFYIPSTVMVASVCGVFWWFWHWSSSAYLPQPINSFLKWYAVVSWAIHLTQKCGGFVSRLTLHTNKIHQRNPLKSRTYLQCKEYCDSVDSSENGICADIRKWKPHWKPHEYCSSYSIHEINNFDNNSEMSGFDRAAKYHNTKYRYNYCILFVITVLVLLYWKYALNMLFRWI